VESSGAESRRRQTSLPIPGDVVSEVVVTGAAGFIGSNVVRQLLDRGRRVVGIDRSDGSDDSLKRWRLSALEAESDFRFVQADVTDPGQLESAVAGTHIEAIINLAARAGVQQSLAAAPDYFATNVVGTVNLLELARRSGIPKFVLASSSSVYGASKKVPFTETDATDEPLSPYAASKKAAEVTSYAYHHLYGIDVTVCRYFTVYGSAGRPDMSPFRFVRWIVEGKPVVVTGDGRQSRDFTYVDDIARGTVAALAPVGFEIVNLGRDRPHELLELIAIIEELTGKTANVVFTDAHAADVPATWANIERARGMLQWEPRVSLREGLAATVDWYQKERDWARDIPID